MMIIVSVEFYSDKYAVIYIRQKFSVSFKVLSNVSFDEICI